MKTRVLLAVTAGLALLLGLGGSSVFTSAGDPPSRPPVVPGAYMVIFNDTVANPADAANDLAKTHGLRVRHVFSLTGNAFSAIVPQGRAKGLERDPRVASVSPIPQAQLFEEVTPTGIDRIDANIGITASRGSGVDVAVLDTGSGPHPDLIVTHVDVTGEDILEDFDGHGTHVAGTIAAIYGNNLDVFGVAPGVSLWGVKVFREEGPTGIDDIQAGLEWLVAMANAGNVIEVANMSLGIACDPASACPDLADSTDPTLVAFHNAVTVARDAGTSIVVAAGNDSTDANDVVPAGYPEVVTVSALTDTDGAPGSLGPGVIFPGIGVRDDDTFAPFSNFGEDIDVIGPGVLILSLDLGSGTITMSGTSMASPHVAGVAALVATANSGATPAQIRDILINTGECADGIVHGGTGCSTEWDGDPDASTLALNEPLVNTERAVAAAVGGPGVASPANSTITASPTSMTADGISGSTITVQLKDANGNNLTAGGDTVTLSTTLGTLSTVTDNADGTYEATLTAGTTAGTATVTGTANGVAITDTATVTFTPGPADAANSTITASTTSVTADGISASAITVQLKDANGNNLTAGGDTVTLSTTLGTLGTVTDNADGTYEATLTAGTTTGTATVTGTVNGVGITDTATVTFVAAPTEQVLEQNTSGGDSVDVKKGQKGAQSFSHGISGDPDYQITKVVLHLSRDQSGADFDLSFSIGTGINSGALPGSTVTITKSQVTDTSEGTTFMTYEVTFATPVGPLTAGTTYYLNFENEARNGKAFYIEYAEDDTYPNGTYYKGGSDDGKDAWFQVWGGSAAPLPPPAPGITVTPTSGLVTTEAGGTDTFTVVLDSEPTASVTIDISSSDTTEGTVAPTSVTFTSLNWNVAQTVTVTGVDDAVDDGDIAYTIVTAPASSTDLDYSGLDPTNVSVTNTDNDTAGITVSPTSGLVTTEAGGTDTFTIVLDSEPTADVTIDISSSDTTEGIVSPASPIFTSINWKVAQTVTITGVDDAVDDGDIAYTIVTAPASSTDLDYSGLDPTNVSVTNTDNDTAGITVSPTSGLVTTEGGGMATFTVVLNTQPTANVSIGLSSNDTSEGTVLPASVTFTTGDWNVVQTVTVTGADDAMVDGDVLYTIVTAPASSLDLNYDNLDPADVSVTNTDNEAAPSEQVLEENTLEGDKIEVKEGQKGAQSFTHGTLGGPDYQVTKVVLHLSKDEENPDSNLIFNIGMGVNSGAISGSTVVISPSEITDNSAGTTFMTFEVTFATPIALTAGKVYYLNFENEAPNGKAFYLEYASDDTYPNGTYYKDGSDDEKDAWFQVWG